MKKTLFSIFLLMLGVGLFGQSLADFNDNVAVEVLEKIEDLESPEAIEDVEADIFLSADESSTTLVKDYKIKNLTSTEVLEKFKTMGLSVKAFNDVESNRLILTGDKAEVEAATKVLNFLDEEELMVEIEFMLVEYLHGNDLDWSLDVTQGRFGSFNDISLATGDNTLLNFVYDGVNRLSPSFKLNLKALAGENKAKILTNPHVTSKGGKEATFKLEENFKVLLENVNALTGAVNQQLQDVNAGINLTVTPTPTHGDLVHLIINGEISQFLTVDLSSNEGAFRTETSTIRTEVDVKNGETLIIGGIIREKDIEIDAGLPWLRKIPVLGYLFKRKRVENEYTERVIYITPRIFKPSEVSREESLERYKVLRGMNDLEKDVETEIETDPGLLKYKRTENAYDRRKERRARKRAERRERRFQEDN